MTHACSPQKPKLSIFLRGFGGGILGLSIFYYAILFAITGDPSHPLTQFTLFQPWMSLLIVGFGVQLGLFWLLKNGSHFSGGDKHDARLTTGASTAVSSTAMVAGVAPFSRTTRSMSRASCRLCGRGSPCVMTVDSRARIGSFRLRARVTSGEEFQLCIRGFMIYRVEHRSFIKGWTNMNYYSITLRGL